MTQHFQSEYDLHCHSYYSDGTLSPQQLVELAQQRSVKYLALTDHDTVAGLEVIQSAAASTDLTIIAGVEISVTWCKKVLHIVGLNIDPKSEALLTLLSRLQQVRQQRAQLMGEKLEKLGCTGVLETALQYAGIGMVTRSHFGRALLDLGYVSHMEAAFSKYLRQGKPGYVTVEWATLAETIEAIRQAGGHAVLAHPQRYNMSATWMRRLLMEFKALGGSAIEVVYGAYNRNQICTARDYAVRFGLMGSVGSDLHFPDQPWVKLGSLAPLPSNVTPIWTQF